MSQRTGVLAVAAAAVLFGTSATTAQLLIPDASATSVAAVRLLVGAAGLVVIVCARRRAHLLLDLWRRWPTWLMGLAVACYQAMFFLATARTGVAIGTLVSLAIAPLLAGLAGWLVGEGAPGARWLVATVIAIAGLVLLVGGGGASTDAVGVVEAAGAGACYAVYTVIGVRLARDGHDATAVLAASFTIGAVVLAPLAVGSSWWATADGLMAALWLGLVATTLAYVLFGVGLRVLQPGHIATINLLEPAVATVLGVVVLDEALAAMGWVGVALIVVALLLLGLGAGTRAVRTAGA